MESVDDYKEISGSTVYSTDNHEILIHHKPGSRSEGCLQGPYGHTDMKLFQYTIPSSWPLDFYLLG